VLGVQDGLQETVDALTCRASGTARSPPSGSTAVGRRRRRETASLVRRHNWLDEELYQLAHERLDALSRR
jgi:hypothetical protein